MAIGCRMETVRLVHVGIRGLAGCALIEQWEYEGVFVQFGRPDKTELSLSHKAYCPVSRYAVQADSGVLRHD